MGIDDQNKLVNAGFQIIRKDDYPSPRIKYRPEWKLEDV